MAKLTTVSRLRVSRGFIGGIFTRMTCRTTVRGLIVREWHDQRYPYVSGMTCFAEIAGLGMSSRFVGSRTITVVTSSIVTRHCRYRAVIE